jgi:sulfoxide reductase heme-binding subunit YedZ
MMLSASILQGRALWYMTRATGIVALVLLSATLVLGVSASTRAGGLRTSRFVLSGLHRNLALTSVAFVAIHVLTAELDSFAKVGWLAVLVPFLSPYRPIWLGLGTVAFDLLLSLVATSLLRHHLGYRTWRVLHATAWLCWPVAVVHGLGTGTDARLGAVDLLTLACVAAVVGAIAWRLTSSTPRLGQAAKTIAAIGTLLGVVAIGTWAFAGPLRSGWAARAGTPKALLSPGTPKSTDAGGPGR